MTDPVEGTQTGGDAGINPAWESYYGDAPQEVRDQYLTPAFKQWDENVNNMVRKVHSEYEPWKPIISQADPQTAQWGLSVANQLNTNPQLVYEALGDFLKQNNMLPQEVQQALNNTPGQGQQQPNVQTQDEEPWKPHLENLQQQNRLMTDYLRAQQQAQIQQQEDARLDQELTQVRQKFGLTDRDMPLVLGFMANNDVSTEQAAQMVAEYQAQFKPRPLIMGSGGGVPGQGINPAKLDAKGSKDLVVQMLAHHAQQQQE